MPEGRAKRLAAIRGDDRFDVVVVGGGVNGIGVYRELALQGLRVLLVERNDFASGCSAAPSRMIHGGLRYLENGEFSLVRESLAERDALLKNAAHFVRPLPTVIPIETLASGLLNSAGQFLGRAGQPSQRGALPIKLGLTLYDWVTRRRRILPRHQFFSESETQLHWPNLTKKARRSAVYYDGWISHPERLCIEMIVDVAKAAPGSVALNYATVSVEDGRYAVTCHRSGKRLPLAPSVVVNATGAWLDSTARALGSGTKDRMVEGTKGSHLILRNKRLAESLDGHMVYFENSDGRVCIVFPYLGHVLAGSTDIRVREATRVRCEESEQAYILESLRQTFPDVLISPQDVVFSFSGVRPLPRSDKDFTGRISRGHSVKRLDGAVPQFCMIGGKWTTFRAFAQQTADTVIGELGRSRVCQTTDLQIGGGKGFPVHAEILIDRMTMQFGVTQARAVHLVELYGTLASKVQEFCDQNDRDGPIAREVQYTWAEVRWLIRNEYVETVSDIALRRTSLAISGDISTAIIDVLAEILASEHGLSPAAITSQKVELISELQDFYGVSLDVLRRRTKERSMECA